MCVHLCMLPSISVCTACVCLCVQVWVYVLSKSIMPFQHYSEGVPSATNAVPDHGVNNLIFNAAVHYAERSRMFYQHPLARSGTDREGEDEEGLLEVNSGAYFSSLFQHKPKEWLDLRCYNISTSQCHCCNYTDMLEQYPEEVHLF